MTIKVRNLHPFPRMLEGTPTSMQDAGKVTSLKKENGVYKASVKGGYRHRRESVEIPQEVIETAHQLIEDIDELTQLSINQDGVIEAAWWGKKESNPEKGFYSRNLTPLHGEVEAPLKL